MRLPQAPKQLLSFGLGVAGMGIAMVETVQAAEWSGQAAMAPGVVYTDNICLTKNNRQGDWIGTVTPSGQVAAKGRNANFNVNASLQLNTLTDSQLENRDCGGSLDRKRYFPRINGKGSVNIIDQHLKVDSTIRADQTEVNSAFAGGGDDFDRRGNTNNLYRYTISPVLTNRFKKVAKTSLRYTFDEVQNSEDVLSDTRRHSVNGNVANGGLTQISWNMVGRYTLVEYEDSINGVPREDTELKSARLKLGYQLDRRYQVNGSYGWEWNDFQSISNNSQGGNAWTVGFRWTPSARTSVGLSAGDRFFGKTPKVDISHTRKRSLFTLNYGKDVTFENDIRLLEDGYLPGGIPSSLNSRSLILDERLSLGYTYTGRRASFNLRGSHSQQERAEDGQQATFKNLAFTYNPQISSVYNLSGTLSWDADEPRELVGGIDGDNQSSTWRASVNLGRQFNNRIGLSLNYQYTYRDADRSINEYRENRVMATLNFSI